MKIKVLFAGRNGKLARARAKAQTDAKVHIFALAQPHLVASSSANFCPALERILPGSVINLTPYSAVLLNWQDSLTTFRQRLIRTEVLA